MDQSMQVPPEFAAALLTLISGLAGYAFREYRNRAKPFFRALGITGDLRKLSDRQELPPELAEQFEGTFYIKPIETETTMRQVYLHWQRADHVKRRWPTVKGLLNQVLASSNEEALIHSLTSLFGDKDFEEWFFLAVILEKLNVPASPSGEPRIAIFEDEQDKGRIWFEFPGDSKSFGKALSVPIVRAKAQPFIIAISHLDREIIFSALREFKEVMDKEYEASIEVTDELDRTLDLRSRWFVHCYLANLSNHPLIIDHGGIIRIDDPTGVRYEEECYLAIVRGPGEDEEAEISARLRDTSHPLVVGSGDDIEFGLITSRSQSEMKLGGGLRESFKRGEAEFQVKISVQKVGLIRRQDFWSPEAEFRAAKEWGEED